MRESRALAEVLRGPDGAKARRDFSRATRDKVMQAAEQHLQAKQKKATVESDMSASPGWRKAPASPDGEQRADAGSSTADDIQRMMQERKALLSAGFDAEAEKIQARLQALRSETEKDRHDLEMRLYKQRLSALELSQKAQREQEAKRQAAERAKAEASLREELAELTAAQALEHQEFELRITRAAALEDVELPPQLLKHRFKPSPKLVSIRESLARLPEGLDQANTAVRETKTKLLAKQASLEADEVSTWRETCVRRRSNAAMVAGGKGGA